MSDLQNKLDKVISDIEKRLTNKEDFEYVKTQIYNIYTIFLDEFDKLEAKCNERMEDIAVRCKVLDDRMNEIEDSIQKIERIENASVPSAFPKPQEKTSFKT